MRCTAILGLAAAAHAFSDSAPVIVVSGETLPQLPQDQLQSGHNVAESVQSILASCPTENYLIVAAPRLHAADLTKKAGLDSLRKAYTAAAKPSRWSVAEVVGDRAGLTALDVAQAARTACSELGRPADVHVEHLKELTGDPASYHRTQILAENDKTLAKILASAKTPSTLIVVADAAEPSYDAAFVGIHADLKRATANTSRQRPSPSAAATTEPLFERYQFFSTGLFTAVVATLPLIIMVVVGLRAIMGLQVSYGAFDRDPTRGGPADMQKKNL